MHITEVQKLLKTDNSSVRMKLSAAAAAAAAAVAYGKDS
jgi:hypothetical protein